MGSEILTVDTLIEKLQHIHDGGAGDALIKCNDAYLHDDEISCTYYNDYKECEFKGWLFNLPIAEKIWEFKNKIQEAYDEFYSIL